MSAPPISAAGGVLWRGEPRASEIAVVHRPRHGDWSLPKGKLEAGEGWEQAALREVSEETGQVVELLEPAGETSYLARGRPKRVRFWHMRVRVEKPFTPTEETDALRWVLPSRALELCDHENERELLRRATEGSRDPAS